MITGIIGAIIGFSLVLIVDRWRRKAEVSPNAADEFGRAEKKLRRRLAGRHRHRLGRRRSELARRTRKVEQLKESIARSVLDEEEVKAFELARATFEAIERRQQSLRDRSQNRKRRIETLKTSYQETLANQAQQDPEALLQQLENELVTDHQKRSERLARQGAQRAESQQEVRVRQIIQRCSERYADSHFAPRLSTGFRCDNTDRGQALVA